MTWIEHVASPLPRECSTTELHGRCIDQTRTMKLQGQIEVQFALGAGEGNRTLVISLENFCSAIELHPHSRPILIADSLLLIAQPNAIYRASYAVKQP